MGFDFTQFLSLLTEQERDRYQKVTTAPEFINLFHTSSDVDSSPLAAHHTIGTSEVQSAAGSHTHDGRNSRLLQPARLKSSINALQSVANNTVRNIVWDVDNYDPNNFHTPGSSLITPTVAGLYLVIAQARWAANSTGRRAVWIQRVSPSTEEAQDSIGASSVSITSHRVTGLVLFDGSADRIQIQCFQSSGAALNLDNAGSGTFVEMFKMAQDITKPGL